MNINTVSIDESTSADAWWALRTKRVRELIVEGKNVIYAFPG